MPFLKRLQIYTLERLYQISNALYLQEMKTIYAIPGLGTTGKLFENMHLNGIYVKILQWPEPKQNMTLGEYAKLFIEQIDQTKPFMLLGVSFGGMLCSELSHLVKAERVFLISSCKNKNELPFLVRSLKYLPLYKLFTENILRKHAFRTHRLLGFKKEYRSVFNEMINTMPKDYLKRSGDMIVHWENTKTPKHCIHIHGKKDRLLLFKNVKADHTIENGSHAMIVYNAEEINALLQKLI